MPVLRRRGPDRRSGAHLRGPRGQAADARCHPVRRSRCGHGLLPSSSGPTESKDAEADHGHAVAAYGVAVIPDGGQEGFPDGGVSALYGVMAIPDSGEEGFPDGGVMAAYGVAVIPDGGKK